MVTPSMPSPGQLRLGTMVTSLSRLTLQLYTLSCRGLSSLCAMMSMKVLSSFLRGMPFAATIKSKKDTRPAVDDGLQGCTPKMR